MILALETSCDETAVALFDPQAGLIGEWVHSQIALHERYGGVVPDLATREHLRTIAPLLERARAQTENFQRVTRVAVTHGPGLAGCLAIGTAAAKALAIALETPLVGINHLRGHAFSPFIALHAAGPNVFAEKLQELLPHLGLIVSGGNTLLFSIDRGLRIRVLSSTRDDAAGEALDKGAKLMALGYPGGPLIEKMAAGGRGDAYDFPRGIGPRSELDFSFSGLKTSLRYLLEKMSTEQVKAALPDLCASYQQAVVDALVRKTGLALDQGFSPTFGNTPGDSSATRRSNANDYAVTEYASLGLSGGVANNRTLRGAFEKLAAKKRVAFLAAQPKHTGDNAGMIAFAAFLDPDARNLSGTEVPNLSIEPSLELAASE
ncbi:MAG TPA: tRNA (adenosine(37)-N6)-threonylcarbamoyltransferase complex transferase subunit TsaD [Opitutaceae bacterium]|nr:tRNA (adenosine(37)-N6)-threonylcarbamoyltransferase complex transferase subunit TsaD [Opitutaceae bacterium]